MKVTVLSIEFDIIKEGRNGEYTATEFTYQPPPYQGQQKDPVVRNIFPNSDIHSIIETLAPGDEVELTFKKEGRFTNIVDVMKLEKRVTPKTPTPGNNPQIEYSKEDPLEKQKHIARAVALKAAVDFVGEDSLIGSLFHITKQFEQYLLTGEISTPPTPVPNTVHNEETQDSNPFEE